jgi:Domain of unknown function (DUF4381)
MNGEDDAPRPVDLVTLIEELQQPPEPIPVSMMPQTWGWAGLAALLTALLLWLLWRGWRRWRANAYRRAALAELELAGDDPARIAGVLRRTALAAWPRVEVASLTGEDWPAFLSRTGPRPLSRKAAETLVAAPYPGARSLCPSCDGRPQTGSAANEVEPGR